MAYTDIQPQYQVRLNSEEFRLICLALAGRMKDHADLKRAAELNVNLLQQRSQCLKNALEVADKALEHAQKAVETSS